MQSPVGGTTSLPGYLEKRTQKPAQTKPVVTPPKPATGMATNMAGTVTGQQQPGTAPKPNPADRQQPAVNKAAVPGMPAPSVSPGMVGSQPIPPAPPPPQNPLVAQMQAGAGPAGRPPLPFSNDMGMKPQQPGAVANPLIKQVQTAAGGLFGGGQSTAKPVTGAVDPVLKQAPATPAGNAGGNGAPVPLSNLHQVIEQQLGSNNNIPQVPGLMEAIQKQLSGGSRYDNPLIQSLMDQQKGELDDVRRSEEDRLKVNAASRGVYHGSGLTNSMGDVSERYVKGLAGARNNLLTNIADAGATDRNSAIGNATNMQTGNLQQFIAQQNAKNGGIDNAFRYGQGEMDNQRLQSDVLSKLAGIGMEGGPTMDGAMGGFAGLPQPQGTDMSDVYALLGSLFARN